jgi:hypothetical protein
MKFLSSPRPFWINLVLIIVAVTLIGIIWSLITQDVGAISNAYFLGTLVLWIVAVVPAFGEMGGNVRLRLEARKSGKDAKQLINAQEEKYQRGGKVTFLFGLAGFICFILAFASLAL